MPDTNSQLTEKTNAPHPQQYEKIVLRAIVSGVFGFLCLLSLILWVRSYTWRDRLVVPLSNARFCRIDSNRGKFAFESYGPNMGEMSFAVSTLSHKDISAAWKRIMKVGEPSPGKKWRWEQTTTGRFFVHVPHWLLVGITLMFAGIPWLKWKYSLRAMMVMVTFSALILGYCAWTTSTPPPATGGLFIGAIEKNGPFEEILLAVDAVVGKRLHSMQLGHLKVASYQYNGPLDKITEAVEPIANQLGYWPSDSELTNQDFQNGLKNANPMGTTDLSLANITTYQNNDGNLLQVIRMDYKNKKFKKPTTMNLLMIRLIDSPK